MQLIVQNPLVLLYLVPLVFIVAYAVIVRVSPPEKKFPSLLFVLVLARILLTIIGTITVFVSVWGVVYDIVLVPYLVIVYALYKYLLKRYRGQTLVTQDSSLLRDLSPLTVVFTLILVFIVITLVQYYY